MLRRLIEVVNQKPMFFCVWVAGERLRRQDVTIVEPVFNRLDT